ncbi:protein NYNRIN-like [Papaver somniferum]|uniref:protein NYNRIN-like n=1 Tax=Papaver somniferum TaxID=3469 RepID=UPI000E6F787C|nr:protein NYNRIN-like [Papaver somniferum]
MEVDEEHGNPNDLLTERNPKRWEILVDGSSNGEGNGIGIVFISPTGGRMDYSFRLDFASTNNETEYEAVVHALRLAIEMKIEDARITSDSQLVIRQIEGTYSTNEPFLQKYRRLVMDLAIQIPKISWRHIGRKDNRLSDALVFIQSMLVDPVARDIEIQTLLLPSIEKGEEVQTDVMIIDDTQAKNVSDEKDWRTEIHSYLERGEFPKKRLEAHKLKSRATNYELRDGVLYRRSFLGPSLRCLTRKEGIEILKALHYSDAGNHSGGRSLGYRVKIQGYYWPYKHEDAKQVSRRCQECQRHGKKIHAPRAMINTSTNVWPFGKWGIDIVGPFILGTGQKRFLIFPTDYFTKWAEVKAVQHIRDKDIFTFIFENIICRFCIPAQLESDNRKQFEGENITMLLNAFKIQSGKSTPLYPQSDGQVEATNKKIADNLKKKLEGNNKGWFGQVHNVVWDYRTTRREATGMSPFCLTYGVEAVLPTEVIIPTTKREAWEKNLSADLILTKLDDSEEVREVALQHMENYQKRIAREHNKRVKIREIQPIELVLREIPVYQKGKDGKLEKS